MLARPRLRIIRSLEAATNTRTECDSGSPARWKAVSGLWPHRPRHGSSRARAVGSGCRVVAHVDRSCGSAPSACGPRPPAGCRASMGRYPVVLGTFLHALAVVGDLTRHGAHVVTHVPVHVRAVTQSYAVRFVMRRSCGRSPSARRPRPPACCRVHRCCCPVPSAHVPSRPGCYPRPFCTLSFQSIRPRPCFGSSRTRGRSSRTRRSSARVGARSPSPFGERIARLRERHGPPAGHPDSAGDSIHPHALLLNGDSSPTLSGYQRLDFSRGGSLFRLPPTAANLR